MITIISTKNNFTTSLENKKHIDFVFKYYFVFFRHVHLNLYVYLFHHLSMVNQENLSIHVQLFD